MLIEALRKAYKNCRIIIYDREKTGCAHRFADEVIIAEYDNTEELTRFAKLCKDGITTEFETVPASAFEIFRNHTKVCPEPNVIRIGQDRLKEKNMARNLGIATPLYWNVTEQEIFLWDQEMAGAESPEPTSFSFPVILKTRSGGYDGNNTWKVSSLKELKQKWQEIGKLPCIIESIVDFKFELSVIIGMDSKGHAVAYPAFENKHRSVETPKGKSTLLDTTTFPGPNISKSINERAQNIAYKIAQHLKLTGILCIEFFYDAKTDAIIFNEMAPRPHNSGHGTRHTHTVSQFNMLATILAEDVVLVPHAVSGGIMTNIIGSEASMYAGSQIEPKLSVLLYGKEERPGRKMGHQDEPFELPADSISYKIFNQVA